MPRLILLNGPPAIGKSTLARRYADDHALTLVIDIDSIRTSMGQWEIHQESMLLARQLARAMAEAQLLAGHDVIIPQLNARVENLAMLAGAAPATGSALHEILLLSADDPLERLLARRAELEAGDEEHPLRVAPLDRRALAGTLDALRAVAEARPGTKVIYTVAGAIEDAYRSLCAALEPDG